MAFIFFTKHLTVIGSKPWVIISKRGVGKNKFGRTLSFSCLLVCKDKLETEYGFS